MPGVSIGVGGTDEWDALSAALDDVNQTLPNDVANALQDVAQQLAAAAQAAILAEPTHGRKQSGLRAKIADSVSIDNTASGATITANMDGELAPLPYDTDQGDWEHPVFGHENNWVTQIDEPGWFSDTMDSGTDDAEAAVGQAMDDAVDKIQAA